MKITSAAVDMETGMRGFMLAGKEEFLDPYKGGKAEFDKLITGLRQTVNDNPAQVQLLNETHETIRQWQENVTEPAIAFRREVGQSKTMDDVAALIGEARGKQYFDKFRGQIAEFSRREMALMGERRALATDTAAFTNKAILGGVGLCLIVSIVIALLLANSIVNPLRKIFQGLKTLSESELESVRERFERVISELENSGDEVARVSQDIASGSTEQASSIEETSSSIEEITGMVQNNVENAESSSQLSEQVQKISTKGNQSMQELVVSMGEILESNEQIQELVKVIGEIGEKTAVIDEIVFQTKLLSFNASVEAERAGEHGRGFAVVAQEVGNLAQMSGKAAQEISTIVRSSIKSAETISQQNRAKVDGGNRQVQDVAKILEEISESSTKVSESANQIHIASKDQANGIGQINNAMSQLDKTTQDNAAATDNLSQQAQGLKASLDVLIDIVRGGDHASMGPQAQTPQNVVQMQPRRAPQQVAPRQQEPQQYAKASGDSDWEKL
jgi:methyl-accepting chemotaxis protein